MSAQHAELIQEASKALAAPARDEVEEYQKEIIQGLLGMAAVVLADAATALTAHEQAGYDRAMREVAADAEMRSQVDRLIITGRF